MSGKKAPKSRNEPVTTLYQKNQPIWKTAIIQVLRGTIGVLETTVVKLETETPKDTSGKKINFLSRWDGFLRTFRLFFRAIQTEEYKAIFVLWLGCPRKQGDKNDYVITVKGNQKNLDQ